MQKENPLAPINVRAPHPSFDQERKAARTTTIIIF
jgi:hypothetical protein